MIARFITQDIFIIILITFCLPADNMLKYFGSFNNVVASDVGALANIVGDSGKRFGPKRAAKLRKEWDEAWTVAQ